MDKIIFVVDDSITNLATATDALEEHYTVVTIPSGQRAVSLLKKIRPDLILLDVVMPEMDGFDVLKHLKSSEEYKDIPIIFLTATPDNQMEIKALEMGVVDFITKPFSPPVLLNRIRLHINISEIIRERTVQLNRAKQDIIFVLADAVENRDLSTGGHLGRTSMFAKMLVEKMLEQKIYYDQIKDWDSNLIAEYSLLHDVGKINTPDAILTKQGRLSPEEFEIIKRHTLAGKSIIEKIMTRSGENIFLYNSVIFATYHHERWDGKGYPFGLEGEEIPLQGRLMAIVDVYDALTSKRVYKDAFTKERAVEIIVDESGKQFDPKIVDAFCNILDQI